MNLLLGLFLAIIPSDRTTTWNPGFPGGVPVRNTICTTVSPGGDIQAAINACPVGQVVKLTPGTFLVNTNILIINKGITLRGSGPGVTILNRTNGAKPGENPVVFDPVVIIGPSRWPQGGAFVNLSSDGVKGSNSVTVANGSNFLTGQIVLLDEDAYSSASWTSLPPRNGQPTTDTIWATDRVVWMKHNPGRPGDDPFPAAASWYMRQNRPTSEVKEVASVSGNTVTFTTPLHINYRVSNAAQLMLYAVPHVRNAGVEDLTTIGGGDGNIRFECAAYSWAKNVESTVWRGEGVAINSAFRVELRDSNIHDTSWPYPGGGGYAISFANGSSEVLVENNIVHHANKVMVSRASGAGSVIGYNYMDDGFIGYDLNWAEVGINGSHMVGSHHMLFEGNYSFNYDSDNTHGNAIYMTVFRNHLSGVRKSYPNTSSGNARAAGLMYGSWWHSFAGNVLGKPGGTINIWNLGYDPQHWDQAADPKVLSTVLREGNFDYVSNTVKWDTVAQTLPSSLYLTSKPAFFGSATWPWVDPLGNTKLYTLPAKARFEGSPIPVPSPTPTPVPSPTPTLVPTPTPTPTPSPNPTPTPTVCPPVQVLFNDCSVSVLVQPDGSKKLVQTCTEVVK